ncbi:MAG: apple domain-containing protein [Alphaproteobacteria bacterium]|nr:MAG: apple domain-containing protein [Alphaproteobacteria bacterium]
MEFSIALAVRGRKRRDPIRSTALGSHAGSSGLLARGPRRLGGALVLLLALAAPASAQVSFDRPGGDYTNFAVRSGDPAACASRCERDPRCRAWSFSYPTGGVPNAICWLKSQVAPWRPNPCCVSGVKGAGVTEPRNPAIEFSIDRVGGDYRNIEVPSDAMGRTCDAVCRTDGRCRAWTYSRPGYYGGPAARCFFKDRVTLPRHDPCCISGVVR